MSDLFSWEGEAIRPGCGSGLGQRGPSSVALRVPVAAVVVMGALVLSACGGEKGGDTPPSQTAAKVNRAEVTVHQINFALQQRQVPRDQAEAASKEVLERLIDQELSVQKAIELKVDRDPKVVQQVEAARREILSRAYVERISNSVAEPTSAEISDYYNKNPTLFKDRKVFKFQELTIRSSPEQVEELSAALTAAKNFAAFLEGLKAKGVKYVSAQVVRASEQLPMGRLDTFAKLKEGDTVVIPGPPGMQVLMLLGAESRPVEEGAVRVAIAQFLLNERQKKMIENDINALRSSAKIEYVGDYAKSADEASNAMKSRID